LLPDAIVIGAGFAGLSAATALAERGARVLVLEARPTLGGRATAFTDPATGERVDNGQHVLFGCYHETFGFLRRIGAEEGIRLQSRLAIGVVDREGRASSLVCPPLPAPFHLLAGVMRWDALGWRDRVAALKMGNLLWRTARVRPAGSAPKRVLRRGAFRLRPGFGETSPEREARRRARSARSDTTVREWLIDKGQTPRLIELLWEPLAVAALNQPIDVAAAAPFERVLAGLFGTDRRDSSLAIPLKPLDELYAAPAKMYIESRGGEVRTNSPARVVCGADLDGPRGGSQGSVPHVRASALHVIARAETLRAPAVICAAPWHALPDVIEDPPASLAAVIDNARRTAPSPIVTVNLWLDRAVADEAFIGLPGRTMQWVFDKRMMFGESASHLSLVSSGAEAVVARSNEELIELAFGELREALPRARAAKVRRAVVVREKRATFSVAPGQPARPPTRTDVPGLALAGDWIDTGLPATIEGAVMSGHAAANAVRAFRSARL
jgi:hydroxysqualene dehydroxylase